MDFCLFLQKLVRHLVVNMVKMFFDQAKELATDTNENNSKKKMIQKTTEATSDLIGNKSAAKIADVSKTSPQNISETVPNEIKNRDFDGKYIHTYIHT